MKLVSKDIFLNAIACPTLGWLKRSGDINEMLTEVSPAEKFRMEQGLEIGKRARTVFPEGILVNDNSLASSVEMTAALLNNPKSSVIFEGAFIVDNFVAKADILKRSGKSWELIEVKSSVNDKEEFTDDMAYTFMVASRCNIPISKVTLMLVSKDFKLGMNNDKLFTEIEHTDDVQARAAQFEALRQPVEEVTRSQNKPVPTLKFECRSCSIFEQCTGKDVDNHIFDIPRLSQRKFNELNELGVDCIEEIPEDFELTENQSHVRRCVQTGKAHVADDLKSMLATAKFPIYYLDFETLMTALPLYPDVAPYTQLPTQYSIHKCSVPGKIENHYEFLSDPSHDSRKALATNLIEALGKEGSIIVYSSFEKTILNNLAIQYPELAKDLSAIATRLIDLNAIILKSFYHPDFHGSTSIKVTLPVLAPELSYDDLEIKDGGTAVVTFAYLALGRFNAKDAELAKKNLLRYCERDTLAMVELHNQLMAFT